MNKDVEMNIRFKAGVNTVESKKYKTLTPSEKMIMLDNIMQTLEIMYDVAEKELYNNKEQVVYEPNSNVIPFNRS